MPFSEAGGNSRFLPSEVPKPQCNSDFKLFQSCPNLSIVIHLGPRYPAPINVLCIGDVPAPNINIITDAADNCANPIVAFVSEVSNNGTCPEIITRTYSVTDDCGNAIILTQVITINDDIAPTASNPASVSVECVSDVPVVDISIITDAADNCSIPVVAFVGIRKKFQYA